MRGFVTMPYIINSLSPFNVILCFQSREATTHPVLELQLTADRVENLVALDGENGVHGAHAIKVSPLRYT